MIAIEIIIHQMPSNKQLNLYRSPYSLQWWAKPYGDTNLSLYRGYADKDTVDDKSRSPRGKMFWRTIPAFIKNNKSAVLSDWYKEKVIVLSAVFSCH